jgi:hypothetical protein
LKVGQGAPGAYSARNLCKEVLAAHAPRLEIDLGVTGREPLNNQPFIAEDRVHENMPVHDRARPGFGLLLEALAKVAAFTSSEEALGALRAFLQVRRSTRYAGQLELAQNTYSLLRLAAMIQHYVGTKSEVGRRAQACVAGILDAAGGNAVKVSQVHDPDRRFPGDVNATVPGGTTYAYEVRDKPVSETDAYHFTNKVRSNGLRHAVIVAIDAGQQPLSQGALDAYAAQRDASIRVFYSWESFLREVAFWAGSPVDWTRAVAAIHARSLQLEVSDEGIRQWEQLSVAPLPSAT